MWRGYGGNGNGAAIVFDSEKLNFVGDSPFVFAKVTYASHEDRLQWIEDKLTQFAKLLTQLQVPDDKLFIAAYQLFERFKIFAIFTKHHEFDEEREWRIAYLCERDKDKKLNSMLDYVIGPRGIEPKLKFKVAPIEGLTQDDLSLEKLVTQIILGPSVSNPLAVKSVQRMLERLGKASLADIIVSSTTPYRAQ
jgi:Protein of unknown function (DUF2971)